MMRCLLALLAALVAGPVAVAGQDGSDAYIYEETAVIAAVDERPIQYYLDRPARGQKVPILLLVDGSGCVGQLRERGRHFYRPGPAAPLRYARLQVEKPGVDPHTDFSDSLECSETFRRHYSITNRVLDHLRVLQHLAASADWWDGRLYLWGWSDGGDVGAQLLTYYPGVTRAVLGAMGGGLTMAEHFEDIWVCPVGTANRDACLADLSADFAMIADNPSRVETWNGESRFTWDSRLRSRLIAPLADNDTPLLIVHGEKDVDNTPVQSARALVAGLQAANNRSFAYWEIADMEHGWTSLPTAQKNAARLGMFYWLFDLPVPDGLLPRLTENSVPALPDAEPPR